MNQHFIICGLGHVGFRILELLHALEQPCAVIARDVRPDWRLIVEEKAACFIEGDARSERSLRAASLDTARAVFIVTNNDLTNIEIALDAQRLNPRCVLIVRVFDPYLAARIGREMSVRNVLSPALLTAPVFVAAALGDEIIRAFAIGDRHLNIVRLPFTHETRGLGETLENFCAERDLLPLAVCARSEAEPLAPAVREGAEPDEVDAILRQWRLSEGDTLIAVAAGKAMEHLQRSGHIPRRAVPTRGRRRTGHRRRAFRSWASDQAHRLRGFWRSTPLYLRGVFFTLLCMVSSSVFVFHAFLPGSPSWIDSIYFAVTILTTVGFGDFNLRDAPDWLKLYGCGLMISGVALVTITFGIITNYIVTERVAQALGHRQSHLTDHIVVIGLGDVGSRVAEELHHIGVPVIAIERDPDHEAVPALQDRLSVIMGDANREVTLRRANIAQARAVIVTTTNDLDSLRIANLAEQLNPALRSVVRIYDSFLANKLGVGGGIEHTVNAAATAAATFAACALQEGVEQGFAIGNRLFALRWLSSSEVEKQEWAGVSVQELHRRGILATMRRAGNGERTQTFLLTATDAIAHGDELLLLEEYDTASRAFASPRVHLYASGMTL